MFSSSINDAPRSGKTFRSRVVLAAAAAIALCAPATAMAIPIPPTDPTPAPPAYLVVTVALQGGFTTPASTPDLTTSELADKIRHTANPWFTEVSHGAYPGGTTTRRGPVTVQPTPAICSPEWDRDVIVRATAEVRKQAVEPDDFQAVIFYIKKPIGAACNSLGAATFPEDGNAVLLYGRSDLHSLVQLLGFNLGLGRSGSYFCNDNNGTRVTLNEPGEGSCFQNETGDDYSAMGALAAFGYNAAQLATLHWNTGRVVTVPSDTAPVTTFLAPLEASSSSTPQAVNLPDEGIWLEYRQPLGVDNIAGLNVNGGLLVRSEGVNPGDVPGGDFRHRGPFLLDLSPGDGDFARGGRVDIASEMTVGQSWINTHGLHRTKITLNSATAFGASVTVQPTITFVTIPDVIGLSTFAARTKIEAAGLRLDDISPQADPLCENLNKVVDQSPNAGGRFRIGTSMSIRFGVEPLNGCPTPQ